MLAVDRYKKAGPASLPLASPSAVDHREVNLERLFVETSSTAPERLPSASPSAKRAVVDQRSAADVKAWLISFSGAAVSLVTAWLGGELVDRLGIGV